MSGQMVTMTDAGPVCPLCESTDIREWDRAERWNRIEWLGDGKIAIVQGQADFETIGLACNNCAAELDAPDDFFDNAEWY